MKYKYLCNSCTHTSEKLKITNRGEPIKCSKCGSHDVSVSGVEIPKTPLTRPFKRETI